MISLGKVRNIDTRTRSRDSSLIGADVPGPSSQRTMTFPPPSAEERPQQRRALLLADPGGHLEPMVEPLVFVERIQGPQRTRLRVRRAEDAACDACLVHEAGTHRAWLKRDVDRAVRQAPPPEAGRRLADRQQLGVSRGVVVALSAVISCRDDLAVADDDRAHRHLIGKRSLTRLLEGQVHVVFVGVLQAQCRLHLDSD